MYFSSIINCHQSTANFLKHTIGPGVMVFATLIEELKNYNRMGGTSSAVQDLACESLYLYINPCSLLVLKNQAKTSRQPKLPVASYRQTMANRATHDCAIFANSGL